MGTRDGQVAIVTGAGRGIGRAIALRLAEDGCRVVANDLPPADGAGISRADATADEIRSLGGQALSVAADVGDRTEVERLFETTIEQFARIDIAVANAATNDKKLIVDTDWPTAQRIIDVTMYGVFHVAQLAAKQMIKQSSRDSDSNGKILMIGSIHAEMATPFHGVYAMAKSAGNRLCKTLASELLPYRINVNAINPGWIDTPGERNYIAEDELQAAAKQLPWGRLGKPAEIAELAAFLTSTTADYITGSIVAMDGGLRLNTSTLTTGLDD